MHERALRRAAMAGTAALLLAVPVAWADTLPADADGLVPGIQGTADLGQVTAGTTVHASVWFELTCKGLGHLDAGQVVSVALASAQVTEGGAVSATGATVGPVPAGWPADGEGCPGSTAVRSNGPAVVDVTAPTTTGPAEFTLLFGRSLSPAGAGDGSAITGLTAVTLTMTVVADQPPALSLPAALTLEATGPAGAIGTFTATATDAEDDPDPVVGCSAASGSVFALGTTTVTCQATDAAGHVASGSFPVTVVDTTPPVLGALPSAVEQTTADPSGVAAAYDAPTALDLVDGAVAVACTPAPGTWLLAGTTTVTCLASDRAGNTATGSFPLTVTLAAPPPSPDPGTDPAPGDPGTTPPVLAARFGSPIGPDATVRGHAGRALPVAVRVTADGLGVTSGSVALDLEPCGGGADLRPPLALRYSGGWWRVVLATAGLPACVQGVVTLDGVMAGAFHLDLAIEGPVRAASAAASQEAPAHTAAAHRDRPTGKPDSGGGHH